MAGPAGPRKALSREGEGKRGWTGWEGSEAYYPLASTAHRLPSLRRLEEGEVK